MESASSQYSRKERAGWQAVGHALNIRDVMDSLSPTFRDRRLKESHPTPKSRDEVMRHLSEHHGENHPNGTTATKLYEAHLQRHAEGWHGGHTH